MGRTRLSGLGPLVGRFVNPLLLRVAGRLPGFAIVSHVGRSSGRSYQTPVNLFRVDGRYLFALTYGSDAHWVRNVLAARGCTIRTGGRELRLIRPEVFVDPDRRALPLPVRIVLRATGTREFLRMEPAP